MDKESAKAWGEQQAREIKNLKAMKKSEKDRIIKIIKEHINNTYPINCKAIIEEINKNHKDSKRVVK